MPVLPCPGHNIAAPMQTKNVEPCTKITESSEFVKKVSARRIRRRFAQLLSADANPLI